METVIMADDFIILALSRSLGIPPRQLKSMLREVRRTLADRLAKEHKVKIDNFGTFFLDQRKKGKNGGEIRFEPTRGFLQRLEEKRRRDEAKPTRSARDELESPPQWMSPRT